MASIQEEAPEITLPGLDGDVHTLSEYFGDGKKALLVFLRHTG
jgi:peroxiredoxin